SAKFLSASLVLIPLLLQRLGHGLRQHGGEGISDGAGRDGLVHVKPALDGVLRLIDPLGPDVLGAHRLSPRCSRTAAAHCPPQPLSSSDWRAAAGSITTSRSETENSPLDADL